MSAKGINLALLAKACFLSLDDFRKYEKMSSGRPFVQHLGERERDSIASLVGRLEHLDLKLFDNFYYSYSIPKIGKEFDLLKFGRKKILNIELKSENVGFERIKNQLVLNYRYLNYLNRELKLYTFVADKQELFCLDKDFNLQKCDISKLVEDLYDLKEEKAVQIDELFKACDYLVSPINEVEKFLNNHYFLTMHQDLIKREIIENKANRFFKVIGEAGTGKTLLLYDLAKELSKKHQVRIVNVDKLTDNLKLIDDYFENIVISELNDYQEVNEEYILIDDSQRISINQLRLLIATNKRIVFFIDPKQVFTRIEINNNINKLIDKLNPVIYKLTNHIRINNDLFHFASAIFDLKYQLKDFNDEKIDVVYASNPSELNDILNYYCQNEFALIRYPNSYNYQVKAVDYEAVLGNEFNNTILIIDHDFGYEENTLITKGNPFFLKERLLYQGLVRTKNKVLIICYRNKSVFKQIIKQAIKRGNQK